MSSLLSRHAESFFWMARYFERAESLARVLETQTSFQRGCGENSWAWIVALYSDEKAFADAFGEEASADNVIRFYMAHADNPGSIQSAIRAARENARALRPMLAIDMWFGLNDFYNRLCAFGPSDFSEVRLSRTCDAIKRGCYAQLGAAESTFYRDETWPFFRLGQFLERADQTSRLLDVRFAQLQTGLASDEGRYDFTFWTILLRAASAYHSYRRIFPRHIDPEEVARFLLFDARMPRSLAFCLLEIQAMIDLLRRNFGLRNAAAPAEKIEAMIVGLDAARRDERLLDSLHNFNDWIQLSLIELTGELEQAFFGQIGEASAAAPVAREPVAIAIANHGRELALRPCRQMHPTGRKLRKRGGASNWRISLTRPLSPGRGNADARSVREFWKLVRWRSCLPASWSRHSSARSARQARPRRASEPVAIAIANHGRKLALRPCREMPRMQP